MINVSSKNINSVIYIKDIEGDSLQKVLKMHTSKKQSGILFIDNTQNDVATFFQNNIGAFLKYKFNTVSFCKKTIESMISVQLYSFDNAAIPFLFNQAKYDSTTFNKVKENLPCIQYNLELHCKGNIKDIWKILQHNDFPNILLNGNAWNSFASRAEYDNNTVLQSLNDISFQLFAGHYNAAICRLKNLNTNEIEMQSDEFIQFKYYMLLAECEHLSTNYTQAKNRLDTIDQRFFQNQDAMLQRKPQDQAELWLQLAHFKKHLNLFEESQNTLTQIANAYPNDITILCRSRVHKLGMLVLQIFESELPNVKNNWQDYRLQLSSEFESLSKVFDFDEEFEKLSPYYRESLKARYNLYRPYELFYRAQRKGASKVQKIDQKECLKIIEFAITAYEQQSSRLLSNAWFVKAEIHRVMGNIKIAKQFYTMARNDRLEEDANFVFQVDLMLLYLECNYGKKNTKNESLLKQKFSTLNEKLILLNSKLLCSEDENEDRLHNRKVYKFLTAPFINGESEVTMETINNFFDTHMWTIQ